MEFRNKVSDYAIMSKKGNMAYWDAIDDLCEDFARELCNFSVPEVDIDDDEILYIANEIRDFAVKFIEKRSEAKFPFVDENY